MMLVVVSGSDGAVVDNVELLDWKVDWGWWSFSVGPFSIFSSHDTGSIFSSCVSEKVSFFAFKCDPNLNKIQEIYKQPNSILHIRVWSCKPISI